ncbi:MAG: hypothetical protein U0166_16725 [Acidobacteriota bacterium]
MDPLSIAGLAFVVVVFWVPAAGIVTASVVGIRRGRRRMRDGTGSGKSVLLAAAALLVSMLLSAGGLFMLWGYAIGTGLGGYTPPLEAALFSVATLSPAPASFIAGAGALSWIVVAWIAWRRRKPDAS